MKTTLAALLLSAAALSANAQKVAVKKDLITVDGQPYARFEKGETEEYYVSSPQNERLFVVRQLVLQDPPGWASYLQFVFTDSHKVVEMPRPNTTFGNLPPSKLALLLYSARLLKNGALDPKAVADFEINYGTPYSARRLALNQPLVQPPLVVPVVQPAAH
ncbi:hypothetical protein [Hymenobacter bucti]|uniref:Uncharacterized protein n=1 Tax=Hymenobacter bucti TaxID=1844114 RepID=A0ABW4QVN2_9BACT